MVTAAEQRRDDERLEGAMLSVQFHALGRQGQFGSLPSIMLPPELAPLPLDEALDIVRHGRSEGRKRDALWTLLRGAPHPPFGARSTRELLRYPASLREFCADDGIKFPLDVFDEKRDSYRVEARLFAGALIAYSLGATPAFKALACAVEARADEGKSAFAAALRSTGALGEDKTALDFLNFLGDKTDAPRHKKVDKDEKSEARRAQESLTSFEYEVGTSLDTYIGEFADTVAFMELWHEQPNRARDASCTVYPAFTVTAQDPRTLTTMVTSTSLASAKDVSQLTPGMHPNNWASLSKTFRSVDFVEDGTSLKTVKVPDPEFTEPRLIREEVRIHPRGGGAELGYFDNLLWVTLAIHAGDDATGWADLEFRLHRSIKSRFLWDERPGGLIVDGGWTKLRSLCPGLWRITARKVLRFSDRTPQTSWDGPLDFGQALNFLAPSTLSAWLEHDIYGPSD